MRNNGKVELKTSIVLFCPSVDKLENCLLLRAKCVLDLQLIYGTLAFLSGLVSRDNPWYNKPAIDGAAHLICMQLYATGNRWRCRSAVPTNDRSVIDEMQIPIVPRGAKNRVSAIDHTW